MTRQTHGQMKVDSFISASLSTRNAGLARKFNFPEASDTDRTDLWCADVSRLEPAAVFALFTWDEDGPTREMDIEISRWGEPADKNAQYVIQPYVVPANTVRFTAPEGTLTYRIDWQPGKVYVQDHSRLRHRRENWIW